MKRLSVLKVVVVLVVAVVAFRFALEGHALTSASFSIPGTYSRGGTGPKLISCAVNTNSITMAPPADPKDTLTMTATLTCANNMPAGTTLNVTLSNVTLSPSIPNGDFFNWTLSGTSLSIPGKSQSSVVATFQRKKKDTSRTYTLTFNVSASTNPQAMDYSPLPYQITVIVQ